MLYKVQKLYFPASIISISKLNPNFIAANNEDLDFSTLNCHVHKFQKQKNKNSLSQDEIDQVPSQIMFIELMSSSEKRATSEYDIGKVRFHRRRCHVVIGRLMCLN